VRSRREDEAVRAGIRERLWAIGNQLTDTQLARTAAMREITTILPQALKAGIGASELSVLTGLSRATIYALKEQTETVNA